MTDPKTPSPQASEHGTAAAHVLRKARALIAEKGWTQGRMARDAYGAEVRPNSPAATCVCINGAILAACGVPSWTPAPAVADEAFGYVAAAIDDAPVATWNDAPDRTREEILAAFDKAIALAETSRG